MTHNYRQKDTAQMSVDWLHVQSRTYPAGISILVQVVIMMFIFQAVIKRLEQERDMARGNLEHLEEERNALRDRLKVLRDYLL